MFKGKAYKWLTRITLILPMSAVLIFLYATNNNAVKELLEAPSFKFPNEPSTYDYLHDPNEHLEFELETNRLIINGHIIIYNDVEILDGRIVMENPEFFKVDRLFYRYNYETNEFELFDHYKLVQDNLVKKGISGVLTLIISGISIGIVILIIFKKMEWSKLHRRLSVLIYLWVATGVLTVLYLIVDNMFLIFITAAISWSIYYLEWLIMRKTNGLPLTDQFVSKVSIAKDGE